MNAYSNAGQSAAAYKQQQVKSSGPEQLTLMLYTGAARFVAENIKALEEGRTSDAHKAHLRAQDIVIYLIDTLDMQYEIAHNLFKLYDYLKFRLNEANLRKDIAQLEEAKGLLVDLRDTWNEAMKKAQEEKVLEGKTTPSLDHTGAVKLTLHTSEAQTEGQ
ncbi:MAG TPA: flagellar export chaperone FliS [Negativicutes bacterium]|nr:flagellar export chaperone FliS [Negativicutes bacterium]